MALALARLAANPRLRVFLIDPPGSSLKSFVDAGTLDASAGSTFLEGIGLNRITAKEWVDKDEVGHIHAVQYVMSLVRKRATLSAAAR